MSKIFDSIATSVKIFYEMKVIIINGPNLNLLGKREPEIYGNISFEDYFDQLKVAFPDVELEYYQSNVEGELINKLHEIGFSYDAIILNAGGYTHTSVALADAVASIKTMVIEVHISNIYSREEYRQHSLLSKHCKGVVCGFGMDSYRLALAYLVEIEMSKNLD
jgi:3-dehydroquinate dehydratase-2